jgi:hypothetical protein
MADKQPPAADTRAERLAAALRENLKKRKERARTVQADLGSDAKS